MYLYGYERNDIYIKRKKSEKRRERKSMYVCTSVREKVSRYATRDACGPADPREFVGVDRRIVYTYINIIHN